MAALRAQLEAVQEHLKQRNGELAIAKTTHAHLSDQLQQFAEYEERSKKDQSQASLLVNENQELQRIIKQNRALERLKSEDRLLSGACYLVRATPNVLLNKRTLACINCYAENKICDNNSSDCQNCVADNVECRRFRCAKVHVHGKRCPDGGFCPLGHTGDDWLV